MQLGRTGPASDVRAGTVAAILTTGLPVVGGG